MINCPSKKLVRFFFRLTPNLNSIFFLESRFIVFILIGIILFFGSIGLVSCGSKGDSDLPVEELVNAAFTPEEIIIDGQRSYHIRGCAKCHGAKGLGDGYRTAILSGAEKPRNFKDLSAYKQGSDVASIAYTIKNGIQNPANEGKNPRSPSIMPAYPMLTDIEINHIAQYVVYLQTNK